VTDTRSDPTVDALAAALRLHSISDDGIDDHGERWFGCICGEMLRGAGRASELFAAHLAAALAKRGYVVVRAEDQMPPDKLRLQYDDAWRYAAWNVCPHQGKYGDDGEMQCHGADFRRQSPVDLLAHLVRAALAAIDSLRAKS